ncbi:hypothetical protein [Microaceticoccus formicicus]|uniref:hypothetical protein n=1 Tax=Microaceticoccus formicicus TaxID=3118105 RepID=UPI003CD04B2F|nr:hypothetical protein VZL98_09565 [Peptoniphilaceae bacterium AMB_02]
MYSIFGWISAGILGILLLPFILLRLNKYIFKTKSKAFFNSIIVLRRLHKPLGVLFLAAALYHGYLILGRITLHTGTVLYSILILTAVFGGGYYRTKNSNFLKLHRLFAASALVMFLVHFFYPYAFS